MVLEVKQDPDGQDTPLRGVLCPALEWWIDIHRILVQAHYT